MNKEKAKVQVFQASKTLQQKAGTGTLDPAIVARAQKTIEENKVDFVPLGQQFLTELKIALVTVEKETGKGNFESQKQLLTSPVMELKANASVFHYGLIGNLANIMLNFLESIEAIDADAISIVKAHHHTLKGILDQNLKGDGGQKGQILINELEDACSRYHKKLKKKQE